MCSGAPAGFEPAAFSAAGSRITRLTYPAPTTATYRKRVGLPLPRAELAAPALLRRVTRRGISAVRGGPRNNMGRRKMQIRTLFPQVCYGVRVPLAPSGRTAASASALSVGTDATMRPGAVILPSSTRDAFRGE